MNLVTFTAQGQQHWGVTAPGGVLSLSAEFPQWKTLRGVIAAGAIPQVLAAARGRAASHTDITWDIPIPDPEKIICVGVNFPDRNAEYRDGQDAPPHMSLFPGSPAASPAMGRP